MSAASRGLRICLLTETFHPVTGGGETQARALAEGLRAGGAEVNLITRRSDPALQAAERIGGVPVHRVAPAGGGHLRKWGLVLTALLALLRLRGRYDVLLVCGYRVLGIPAMLVSLASGKPCVLKADSQGELSGRFFDAGLARLGLRHDRFPVNMLVWLRNRLLRRAAGFVAISGVIEAECRAAGIRPERVARIPNSVDTHLFKPVTETEKRLLRERLELPAERPIAVFTGRLVKSKGLPCLLQAWTRVLAGHPDALLVLVGGGGLDMHNCEAELRAYVAAHGLGSSVVFTGPVSTVHEYLQAADLFVFPSEREAFGISIIEAMACGLPIVTTLVDGIRDVVRPGVDALGVPAGDDAALADAIGRVLDQDAPVQDMASAARRRAVEAFATDTVVESYRALLAGLVRT
jgi:glycosyltransferase involved in cell wall biosynthesis